MFDSIHGCLLRSEPTRVVIAAHGIGYEVRIPLSTYEVLPGVNADVDLLLHLVVRENEWLLYGFHTAGERDVFRALLRVTGVGPTLALGLLSGLTPGEFRVAVTQADVKALTRVKGIGRKTAERILVELKDVVEKTISAEEVVPTTHGDGDVIDDAVQALVALGLPPREARRRVDAHAGKLPEATVTELVRAALRG